MAVGGRQGADLAELAGLVGEVRASWLGPTYQVRPWEAGAAAGPQLAGKVSCRRREGAPWGRELRAASCNCQEVDAARRGMSPEGSLQASPRPPAAAVANTSAQGGLSW